MSEIRNAYLAGGTAMALQIGHRISVDLDFFTQEKFNEKELSKKLATHKEFVQAGTAKWTVWGEIGDTKFSIFHYQYPLIEPTISFEGLHLASLADIAAMKIHAIEERGTRRDFVDVYFLAKYFTLPQMLDFYQKKYAVLDDHFYHILRSLDYFEDAEKETDLPKMLKEINWEEIKVFFREETKKLVEKKLKS
jgi:predicted nucleotidyltransferase component of viral defense system